MAELTAANMQGFDQAAEKRFFEQAVNRLKEYFGERIANAYTTTQLEAFTQLAIKRARGNNVTSEGGILDYLLLMSWFGAYFDLDKHYSFLHPHIHLSPEDSLKGKTVHAVHKGEAYEDIMFFNNDAKQSILFMLQEYITSAQLIPTDRIEKTSLAKAIDHYMPMKNLLIESEGLLEELYIQAAPADFGFTHQSTQLVWFMLMIVQGFRFHQNPLFPGITEVLNQSNQENNTHNAENQRQKLIETIEIMMTPYYFPNIAPTAENNQ